MSIHTAALSHEFITIQSGVCESAMPVAIMSAAGHQERGGSSKQKTQEKSNVRL
jgi:hypothetical protein